MVRAGRRGARRLPLELLDLVRPELRGDSAEDPVAEHLRRRPQRHAGLLGVTDSETIFAGLLDRLWDGGDLTGALAATIRHVSGVCAVAGVAASLNLAITDGEAMAFTRHSTEGPGNSLYFVEGPEALPGAIVVASERLDTDEGWREVPDRHLLHVTKNGATLRAL